MKCFNHHDKDAIGVCSLCGKGLCEDCFVEVSKNLACKNSCEEDVVKINEMRQQNIEMSPIVYKRLKKAKNQSLVKVLIFSLLGLTLLTLGIIDEQDKTTLFLGLFMLFLAIISLCYMPKSMPDKTK